MSRLLAAAAAAVSFATLAAGAAGAPQAADFAFYPQAGVLWRDLYVNNFVDLDPGPGVRDFACGTRTYDGHTVIDSDVRSFREMDLGVPVFAALDGRVISVQDGSTTVTSARGRLRSTTTSSSSTGPAASRSTATCGRGSGCAATSASSPASSWAGPHRAETRPGRTCTSPRTWAAR